ncbi:MAG TPA: hypothetical protein VK790_13730 [Solirubrobacteraceae bacterium]|jgi:hypothetical protein|nr:hypothetical protein [Solirubrobacteraceae bacterium]
MKATRVKPTPHAARRPARRRPAWRACILAAALAALALLAAACGGTSPGSGVAHLGKTTASTGKSTSSSAGSGAGSGEAQPGSQAIAYSACVRAHGVPSFPDPKVTTNGSEVKVAIGINPSISSNPHFQSAQQACRKLLPGGGPGSGSGQQIGPQEQSQYLKAAACIRAHGIPNFPDPTFAGGGVHIPKTAGVNLHSPQARAAEEACQSLIPGGLHGNH